MVAVAAAVIIAAAVVPLFLGGGGSPAQVAGKILLRPAPGAAAAAGGQAVAYRQPGGFKITLHVHGLRPSRPGQYYGCWYVGPKNGSGQPKLITAGSFTVGRSGTANVTMWSAADPAKFRTMEITIDTGAGPGKQVLIGHALL
jgi:hypothetical protein